MPVPLPITLSLPVLSHPFPRLHLQPLVLGFFVTPSLGSAQPLPEAFLCPLLTLCRSFLTTVSNPESLSEP